MSPSGFPRPHAPRRSAWLLGLAGALAPPLLAAEAEPATPEPCAASDPRCRTAATPPRPASAALGPTVWRASPAAAPVRPPDGMTWLATACTAWLLLLGAAAVVRPRGWHHRPLFGKRAADAAPEVSATIPPR